MSRGNLTNQCTAAFGFAANKSGHNVDRNTEEKITDAGRNAYEKMTGYVSKTSGSSEGKLIEMVDIARRLTPRSATRVTMS